jgi:hypothetical protein
LTKHNFASLAANWIKSLSLTKLDEEILLGSGELNADHMYGGQLLLKRRYPLQQGLKDTSYLSDKLLWSSKPVSFVQIIHVGTNHWACLSNKYCSSDEVELYDSLHSSRDPDESVIRQVCAILKSPAKKITVKVINVQQQCGSTQCGLFALAFASDLCADRDPFTRVYFESKFRSHLLKCFVAQEIDSFPSRERKNLPERSVTEVSLNLFCVCRQPEELPMVSCDRCCEWYHKGCMSIPEEVFSDPSIKWFCESCGFEGIALLIASLGSGKLDSAVKFLINNHFLAKLRMTGIMIMYFVIYYRF